MNAPGTSLHELDPERVQAALTTARMGRSLRFCQVTDSTNDDARRDALLGAPDGHVVVADSQGRGRGSHGRQWTSPPGEDLYLSIVARPQLALAQLPPLTLAVGLGVAHAVEHWLGAGARAEVKWPNDVRISGKKCAGILVEASSIGSELGPLVIGIGLNVNRMQWPDELSAIATSLRAVSTAMAPLNRGLVLARLLQEVEHWVDRFIAEGGEPIAEALQQRLAMRGARVRCGALEGALLGVAATGALRIATAAGIRELIAGRLEPCP